MWAVQEDEESGIGDVDLFTLSEDKTELTVNAKWLQHLQVATLTDLMCHVVHVCG